jgi:hypothetical protein
MCRNSKQLNDLLHVERDASHIAACCFSTHCILLSHRVNVIYIGDVTWVELSLEPYGISNIPWQAILCQYLLCAELTLQVLSLTYITYMYPGSNCYISHE